MFTVRRLGVSDRLTRSLSCTNAIESTISGIPGLTGRVTKLKDTKMVIRSVAAGMLEAQRSVRRIKGHPGHADARHQGPCRDRTTCRRERRRDYYTRKVRQAVA
jgi:hypothetical protein